MYPKKSLGQNFLIDQNKIKQIVSLIPEKETSFIIEVGPGKGALTKPLSKVAKKIVAIEIDLEMIKILNQNIHSKNFRVIHKDALKISWDNILKTEKNAQFVSNLPYYISTKIIFSIVGEKRFNSMSIMLQKELVDRIFAKPNTKIYGRLTVSIGSIFTLEEKIDVPSGCFSPKPNVDSGFIVLKRKENFNFIISDYLYFIKCAFAMKRKTLINSLKISKYEHFLTVLDYLKMNNLKENIRSEEVDIETFKKIFDFIIKNNILVKKGDYQM